MYPNTTTHRRDPRMADSDGADYATRERRRAADLRFIAALRMVSAEELREALEEGSGALASGGAGAGVGEGGALKPQQNGSRRTIFN